MEKLQPCKDRIKVFISGFFVLFSRNLIKSPFQQIFACIFYVCYTVRFFLVGFFKKFLLISAIRDVLEKKSRWSSLQGKSHRNGIIPAERDAGKGKGVEEAKTGTKYPWQDTSPLCGTVAHAAFRPLCPRGTLLFNR